MSTEKKIQNEGILSATEKFLGDFFDGLKTNTLNPALEKAKKRPELPNKFIDKMEQLDKLSKELKTMSKQLKTLKK
jgi:hypothetical protein